MTETVNAVAPSIIHGIRFRTIFAKRRVFNKLFIRFCSPDFSDHFSHFNDGIKLSPGCARAVWMRAKSDFWQRASLGGRIFVAGTSYFASTAR